MMAKGFSMFVPEELILHDKIAWIQVEEISRDGDRVLVRLPRPSLESGATITVNVKSLIWERLE